MFALKTINLNSTYEHIYEKKEGLSLFNIFRKIFKIDVFSSDLLVNSEDGLSLCFKVTGGIKGIRDKHLIVYAIRGSNV